MEQTIAEDQKTYGGAAAKSKATTAPSSVTSTAKELHAGQKRTYIDAGLHEESITEAQRSITDPATLQSLKDLRDIITGMEIQKKRKCAGKDVVSQNLAGSRGIDEQDTTN